MSSQIAAKSILKQPKAKSSPTISDEQKAKAAQDRKNLGIALYHANKIQEQKDVSSRILSVIETLVEYPLNPTPTSEEASRFTNLIEIFQPSDFDGLVEERRIEGKCGYVLCPKAPRSATLGASAAWKLQSKAAGNYCSNVCTRKALYVRTQLSEVPAWEREPGQQAPILPDEDVVRSGSDGPSKSATQAERRVANGQELAFERGETTQSFKPRQVVTDAVVEKTPSARVNVAAPVLTQTSHTKIEGYEPKGAVAKTSSDSADEEDDSVGDEDLIEEPTPRDGRATQEDHEAEESWRDLYQSLDNRN